MTYVELLSEFWRQNGFKPFGAMDATVYFYLVHQCYIRDWLNPFELQTRNLELALGITRKSIQESKNRLKQRGMIDFTDGNRGKTPSYSILGLNNSCVSYRNVSGNITGNINGNITGNTSKERSPIPPKEIYTPIGVEENNNIPLSRASEEKDLEKFDSLLQEVADGKCQIWEDEMRIKHGIDSVIDYLPSFRSHVIANATAHRVADINGFKSYFNVAFRYFSKSTPIEQLMKYRDASKSENFVKYCDWIRSKAPNVANGILPLTEEELTNLTEAFGKKEVFTAILDLNNREDLIAKYFALYRTLIKWLKRDQP